MTPSETDIAMRMAELLGEDADLDAKGGPDLIARVGPNTFVIESRAAGTTASIAGAARRARGDIQNFALQDAVPLVVVPYMGEAGRLRCEKEGVSWVDMSGNATIEAPGIKIVMLGQPNRYKSRGRPSSVFAPKSARIARWLLISSDPVSQRSLAKATQMDEGFTSRIVGKLLEDDLIARDPAGLITVPDRELLLDAWLEDYDFSKHKILRGHIPARNGTELLQDLTKKLSKVKNTAATGLAGAWALTHFAGFRIATIYMQEPTWGILVGLGFREGERGANTWIVAPNDAGVFHGAAVADGVPCVHPVQCYLDLHAHPERSKEAADHLRAELLNWGKNDA